MKFINRQKEMERLDRVMAREDAAFVVVWGRRRLGKSRLLTEWCARHNGTYWVADESAGTIQRQYFANEMNTVFPGFSAVAYPDWHTLFKRLSHEARQSGWRGPLIIDEFPYLVSAAPEISSVLQQWVDREKREGGIVLALSGSSQRMMMSSILNSGAPLYGRADEVLKLNPILPGYISHILSTGDGSSFLDYYSCWGGVPRYWELSQNFGKNHRAAVDDLMLSPLGVLHDEIDRLLRQEMPSAIPLRPILDAIGLGAHKSSEIAGRLGLPATSLTRSLKQLQELGYILREVPYGEDEKRSKKALYKLADPFLRLWFRVVASHRGTLQSASETNRLKMLTDIWPQLRAEAWEELCRQAIPHLLINDQQWGPSRRHWMVRGPEWDVVTTSLDGSTILLGECKSLNRAATSADLEKIMRGITSKQIPPLRKIEKMKIDYAIFVPCVGTREYTLPPNVHLVDSNQVFEALQ
ncbi:MAG: ATP-binding protein [Lentisphaeria bacterium]|nr:ATP-binding protein [Lentisphaeria bacterium]